MKLGEVDGKKIGCTVSLLVSSSYSMSLVGCLKLHKLSVLLVTDF